MSPGSEQSETHDVFGFCIPFMFCFFPLLVGMDFDGLWSCDETMDQMIHSDLLFFLIGVHFERSGKRCFRTKNRISEYFCKSYMQTKMMAPCVRQMCNCAFVFQRDHLKIAQQFFQLVGGSASECGTPHRNLTCFIIWGKCVSMCVLHFLSFQILFLADSAWPPASFSWNSLKTFSFISTRSRLVLLACSGESVLFIFLFR